MAFPFHFILIVLLVQRDYLQGAIYVQTTFKKVLDLLHLISRLRERYHFSPVLRIVNVVMFLTFIWEILNSDPGQDTDYPGFIFNVSLRP